MRRAPIVFVTAFVLATFPATSRADPPTGNIPFIAGMAVVGTVGGLATSISAIVFATQDRAFTKGWAVASLISAGFAGGMAGALAYQLTQPDSSTLSLIAFMFFTAVTVWPAYYTIKGAASPVEPGGSFSPSAAQPISTEDPIDLLDRRPSSSDMSLQLPTLGFQF